MTFNEWVMQATITNDPAGDFIADTKMCDGRNPLPLITEQRQLEAYVWKCNPLACDGALDALPVVWKRYEKARAAK